MEEPYTWLRNEKCIRELWATAEWGEPDNELRSLFKRALSKLNQCFLSEAIEKVKLTYTSQQPELKWFMSAYEVCAASNRITGRDSSRQIEKTAVEADSKETQLFLDAQPRSAIVAAVSALRSTKMISQKKLDPKTSLWSREIRGLVRARIEIDSLKI